VWLIAAVSILFTEKYFDSLFRFQLGVMRVQARLFAYHASLVEEYPRFALAGEPPPAPTETGAPASPATPA
jgi:hypothetical protein